MANAMSLAPDMPANDSQNVKGTRMESFAPIAGSIVVFGYDLLGEVAGVALEVREILDDKGSRARGALVTVTQDQYHTQNSFIDEDEIPELLKGFDAIIGVARNPTKFQFFEVKYRTKGEFELLAFNNRNGLIVFGVKAGRGAVAQVFNLQVQHLQRLKSMFEAAEKKIKELDLVP